MLAGLRIQIRIQDFQKAPVLIFKLRRSQDDGMIKLKYILGRYVVIV